MPRRPGRWDLLDQDHDPVESDVPAVDDRVARYRDLADMMETEGRRLRQIADGQSLTGQYADKLRESAGDVADDLLKVVDRYHAVVEAVTGYVPALETALTGSAAALDAAVTADQALSRAKALPTEKAPSGKSLTSDQQASNDAKNHAHDAASDDLAAAKSRLQQVLSTLDDAGQRAAGIVRGGFSGGLQDSGMDRFKYHFMKFLKILVKVLTYIGIALAALALIIPGVGAAVLAAVGAAIAVIELAAQTVLTATGNGSWTDVAMAIVGVATLGAGKALGALKGLLPGKAAGGAAGGAKGGAGTHPGRLGSPEDSAVPGADRFCKGDPVDVATGENVLPQVDLDLPVPLVRTHLSSYRAGALFGPSWASTLDQRVEVDGEEACWFAPDGTVLFYPAVPTGTTALPLAGPPCPLTLHPDGTAELVDPEGRTVRFTPGPAGSVLMTSVVSADGARLDVERDGAGLPVTVRSGDGTAVGVVCDEGRVLALHLLDDAGRRSSLVAGCTYDERGDLVAVTNASGRSLRFSYDGEGRLSSWRDRNGFSYLYAYDERGRCVRTWGEHGHLNGTFVYDDADDGGSRTTHTDSLGHTSTHLFDRAHHLLRSTDPLGATTSFTWQGSYLASRTDPLGRTTRFTRDRAGRVRQVRRPDGSVLHVSTGTGRPGSTVLTVHDGDGTWSQVLDGTPDVSLSPWAATGPGGGVRWGARTSEQDATSPGAAGRVVARPGRFGRAELVRHDAEGNPVERVDAAGGVVRLEHGTFDLVTATVDAAGARTTYDHDTELRLVVVTDPAGLRWSYDYDAAGRLVREEDFDGRVLTFEHDVAGQLLRTVNGAGEVVEHRHDALGNLVERTTASGSTTYSYDPLGRLVGAEGPDCVLAVERDGRGRVLAQTTDGRTLSFAYDDEDRVVHRLTPSGVRSSWSFDDRDRPVALTTAGHAVGLAHGAAGVESHRSVDGRAAVLQAHGPHGELVAQLLPGRLRLVEHRADGVLAAVRDEIAGTARGNGHETRYELDANGRVLAVVAPGHEERYAYDPTGALVSATTGSSGPVEVRVEGTRAVSAGGVSYRHDRQGRTVARTEAAGPGGAAGDRTWRYAWDAEDHLTEVTTPNGEQWRYRYDPLGRRTSKERCASDGSGVAVERVDFTWDGPRLVEEVRSGPAGAGVTSWEHHPGTGHPVTQLEHGGGGPAAGRFSCLVTDAVGTVTGLLAPDGSLRERATHLWGAPLVAGGAGPTPLGFPGQYRDQETGLHQNVHRYYDPGTARYLSQDPLGLAAAPHPTAYVDNPLVTADPLGLAPSSACSPGGGSVPGRPGSPTPSEGNPWASEGKTGSGSGLDHPWERSPWLSGGNDGRPGLVFHGSSIGPDVVMAQGLKSSASLKGGEAHYDLGKHVHNPEGSGFTSTTGNFNAALQFVRSSPGASTVTKGGTTYLKRDGYVYSIRPSDDMTMIHVPKARPDMARFHPQDEWAKVGDIAPGQITGVHHISGFYNSRFNPSTNAMGVDIAPGTSFSSTAVSGWGDASTTGAATRR